MSVNDIWKYWKKFWFRPESPLSLSVFRILVGFITLEYCLLLYPDLLNWFGAHSISTVESSRKILEFMGPTGINIFNWMPPGDTSIIIVFGFLLIASICLTAGFCTRLSALLVYVALASFQQQNGMIVNGGHILMKMTAFYLIFAPSSYFLSIDAWLKKRKQFPTEEKQDIVVSLSSDLQKSSPSLNGSVNIAPSGWTQRMLRFLIALIYFQAFWSKLEDKTWLDGTALYYVLRQQEFMRFPIEWISNNLWLCQSLTWGALIIEFAMFSLLWFKETRYFVLVGALLLHAGIEYTMNLPIFESIMMAYLVLFIPSKDLMKAYYKLRLWLAPESAVEEQKVKEAALKI